MPAGSASPKPHRDRWLANCVALAVLVSLAVAAVLWRQPWPDEIGRGDVDPDRAVDAAAELTERAQQLSDSRTRSEFAKALGPDRQAQQWAADIAAARRDLAVGDVQWRYLAGGNRAVPAGSDDQADFEVRWGTAERAVFTLAVKSATDGDLSLIGVTAAADPLPVWLAGAVEVERDAAVTVIRIDRAFLDVELTRAAPIARQQVRRVIHSADNELTVIATPSARVAAMVLGRSSAEVQDIAGVATTREGRDGKAISRAVVLNPERFERMDARAAQVVLTHEAAHVMTEAIGTEAQPWVVEGFADYVALRDDTAPLSVSAGEILQQVAQDGAPQRLPAREEFESRASGLSAAYESSWMAMRALRSRHSEADLIRFYRLVLAGRDVDSAATTALGESTESITALWRRSLQTEARKLTP